MSERGITDLTDEQWRAIAEAAFIAVRCREAKSYDRKDFALAAPPN